MIRRLTVSRIICSAPSSRRRDDPHFEVDSDLKPEIVTSWEVGVDLRMFRNRLNLDVAYYDGQSKNLIANMPVSYAVGASSVYTNAGTIRNWGVEVTASGTLIKTNSVQWRVGVNWSMNRNKVLSLGEGIDSWSWHVTRRTP